MEAFPDGSLYLGQYADGCASGLGVCLFLNGDLYEGQVSGFEPCNWLCLQE